MMFSPVLFFFPAKNQEPTQEKAHFDITQSAFTFSVSWRKNHFQYEKAAMKKRKNLNKKIIERESKRNLSGGSLVINIKKNKK